MNTEKKINTIRLLILDVDGVLTDGRIWLSPTGEEYKNFHVHDGLGIKLLQNSGIPVAIISSRKSNALDARVRELGIAYCYTGQTDKLEAFKSLLNTLQLEPDQIAYIGDDLPDLPIMKQVGLAIAVPNAVDEIKAIAAWITSKPGGEGAVREVCDTILALRQRNEAKHLV